MNCQAECTRERETERENPPFWLGGVTAVQISKTMAAWSQQLRATDPMVATQNTPSGSLGDHSVGQERNAGEEEQGLHMQLDFRIIKLSHW